MIYNLHTMMTQVVIVSITGICGANEVTSEKEIYYSTVGMDVTMNFQLESNTIKKIEVYMKCGNASASVIADMKFENGESKSATYYRNRTLLTYGNSNKMISLKLNGLKPDDFNCLFSCHVYKDSFKFSDAESTLKQAEKPKIIPSDTFNQDGHYLKLGSKLFRLKCYAEGVPDPTVTWSKTDSDENTSELSNEGLSESSYEIRNATKDDTARYKCIAKNVAGTAEKEVNVFVVSLYYIDSTRHITKTGRIGDVFEQSCPIDGNPRPDYLWKDPVGKERESNREILIHSIESSDYGNYSCSATNKWGTLTYTVTLTPSSDPLTGITPTIKQTKQVNSATSTVPLVTPLLCFITTIMGIVRS